MSRLFSFRRGVASLVVGSALTAAACVPAPPRPISTFELEANYAYGEAIDEHGRTETLTLDLFRPVGGSDERTAIVLVHSGGFTTGLREEMDAVAKDLARRGYVVATISYRVREGKVFYFHNPSTEALDAIVDARHDAQAAVRWVRTYAEPLGIDPDAIAIGGYSAGAITALGVAQNADDPGASGHPGVDSSVCLGVSVSGFAMSERFDVDDAPVLVLHGADDPLIPPFYARITALRAAHGGKLVEYIEYPGVGHLLLHQRTPFVAHEIDKALAEHCS